jgi:hypothetical protein
MGVAIIPAASSAPTKSIQRGVAASSGAITISAVDTSKTFVRSFSNGSAGSVGATGTETGGLSRSGGTNVSNGGSSLISYTTSFPSYSGTRTFAAGATSLTSANYGVVLTNSTTLTADGACYWEVVEYN